MHGYSFPVKETDIKTPELVLQCEAPQHYSSLVKNSSLVKEYAQLGTAMIDLNTQNL